MNTGEEQKHDSKESESSEDYGVDYERELIKSKKMEIELGKGNDLVRKEHHKLNTENSTFTIHQNFHPSEARVFSQYGESLSGSFPQ